MEAYSKEFRRDVLRACDAGGGTREVALRFNVSESWVRRVKQERREQGKVAPSTTRRRHKVWEPYAPWLLAKLDAKKKRCQNYFLDSDEWLAVNCHHAPALATD